MTKLPQPQPQTLVNSFFVIYFYEADFAEVSEVVMPLISLWFASN